MPPRPSRGGRQGLLAHVDLRSTVAAALDRYSGRMYEVQGFREAVAAAHAAPQSRVLILSGAYGMVLPDEFIHLYDQRMNAHYWKEHGLGTALGEFIEAGRFRRVVAFVSRSTLGP